jgi:hypothetical protein
MQNADYWHNVIRQTQTKTNNNGDTYWRKNGASARNPLLSPRAEAEQEKKIRQKKGNSGLNQNREFNREFLLSKIKISCSSQQRAAGLLVDKGDDNFERQLAQDLQNVKGIDLDGDGQIDDDELEFAKEMEARLIRSKAFCSKVKQTACPWSWFGGKWKEMTYEQRVQCLYNNPHFDVGLDAMVTKLRNYTLTQSPRMYHHLAPKISKIPTNREKRQEHEEAMYEATQAAVDLRLQTATIDPLSTQPQSYREYLTALNPITQRYTFE